MWGLRAWLHQTLYGPSVSATEEFTQAAAKRVETTAMKSSAVKTGATDCEGADDDVIIVDSDTVITDDDIAAAGAGAGAGTEDGDKKKKKQQRKKSTTPRDPTAVKQKPPKKPRNPFRRSETGKLRIKQLQMRKRVETLTPRVEVIEERQRVMRERLDKLVLKLGQVDDELRERDAVAKAPAEAEPPTVVV